MFEIKIKYLIQFKIHVCKYKIVKKNLNYNRKVLPMLESL